MNKLPKYWAVQCPKDCKTNKNWRKVTNYLSEISSANWSGAWVGYNYGVCK